MGRPKFNTRKDKTSHKEVITWLTYHNCHLVNFGGNVPFYRGGFVMGYPLFAADISNVGGWVDWLIWIGEPGKNLSCAWECKEPGKEKVLTHGEEEWRDQGPTLFYIIVDLEDCDLAAEDAIETLRKGEKK